MYVIVSNGPRSSGKDTMVKLLLKMFPTAVHVRIKDVLYQHTYEHFQLESLGMSFNQWVELCNNTTAKITRVDFLGDLSPVEALVWSSEIYFKGQGGENAVIEKRLQMIEEEYPDYRDRMFIFSDGGFTNEYQYICKHWNLSRKDRHLVRITRPNCKYVSGDNRHFIPSPSVVFNNRHDLNQFLAEVKHHFELQHLYGEIPFPVQRVRIKELVLELQPLKVST